MTEDDDDKPRFSLPAERRSFEWKALSPDSIELLLLCSMPPRDGDDGENPTPSPVRSNLDEDDWRDVFDGLSDFWNAFGDEMDSFEGVEDNDALSGSEGELAGNGLFPLKNGKNIGDVP